MNSIISFPLYPPEELFHALGLNTIILWGLNDEIASLNESDAHIENFSCGVARKCTQYLISELNNGKLNNGINPVGLYHYNACDTLRNLPEILMQSWKDKGLSGLELFDIHIPMTNLDDYLASTYLINEINELIIKLENKFSRKFNFNDFKKSVDLYRIYRSLLADIEEFVSKQELKFIDYVNHMYSIKFDDIETKIQKTKSFIEKKRKTNPQDKNEKKSKRIMLSGIIPPPNQIIEQIEENGIIIASNDIAFLRRSHFYTPKEFQSVGKYYVDFYKNHYPCTTLPYTADRRINFLLKECKDKEIEGFIFVGEKYCEYEYFELPYLKKKLVENGIIVLQLEFSAEDKPNYASIKTRIDAFVELLKG